MARTILISQLSDSLCDSSEVTEEPLDRSGFLSQIFLPRIALDRKERSAIKYAILFSMSTAIQAELPPELLAQAQAFVEEGGAKDVNELLAEALRRYLESHSSQLTENFIREDVEWGLNGNE